LSGRLRLVLLVTPHQRRRPTLPAPWLGRERTGSRRPKRKRPVTPAFRGEARIG
jgi:hypothetical protein